MAGLDQGGVKGIEERLDLIARLLTVILTKDMSKKEAVLTLSGAGFAPKHVAGILGLTGNQVSVILYDARQATGKQAPAGKATAKA